MFVLTIFHLGDGVMRVDSPSGGVGGRHACVCVPEGMHWGRHVRNNCLNHLVPRAYAFMAASPIMQPMTSTQEPAYIIELLIQSCVTYTSVEKSISMKTASSVPCSCSCSNCIPFEDARDILKHLTYSYYKI